jgi:hypothetical protein
VRGDDVSFVRAGKPALRTERKILERDVFRRFLYTPAEDIALFQESSLGRDEAQDDALAARDEPQRLKIAGTFVVVFEQEMIDVEAAEDDLGDALVAAGRKPRGTSVPGTNVNSD